MKRDFADFFQNKDKITKSFIMKREAAPKNFWCHTPEATEFYAYWDRKWLIIQNHFDRQFKKICVVNNY